MKNNEGLAFFRRPAFIFSLIGVSFFVLLLLAFAVIFAIKSFSRGQLGTFNINTVRFMESNPKLGLNSPEPGIWIDTNTVMNGFFGGRVSSSKPYSIAFYYTDNTFTFSELEFTSIKVSYDDGKPEPAIKSLKIPLSISARKYECINSVNGGKTVKTTVSLLSGKIPGVINRDEPFSLQIKGKFTKKDGSEIQFTIDKHFDIEKVNTRKAAKDVLADC